MKLIPTELIDYDNRMVRIEQIRAARGLLNWNQTRLANEANVSLSSVKSLESGRDVRASVLIAVERALIDAGVLFLDPGDTRSGGYGLRLRQ